MVLTSTARARRVRPTGRVAVPRQNFADFLGPLKCARPIRRVEQPKRGRNRDYEDAPRRPCRFTPATRVAAGRGRDAACVNTSLVAFTRVRSKSRRWQDTAHHETPRSGRYPRGDSGRRQQYQQTQMLLTGPITGQEIRPRPPITSLALQTQTGTSAARAGWPPSNQLN
jgi:hypothetical protein